MNPFLIGMLGQALLGGGMSAFGKLTKWITGEKSDAELDREIARNNKEVQRQMRQYVKVSEESDTSAEGYNRGSMISAAAKKPTFSDIMPMPVVSEPSNATANQDAGMAAPPQNTPSAAADPVEMIGLLQGSPELAAKLVGSAQARGDRANIFDYHGIML